MLAMIRSLCKDKSSIQNILGITLNFLGEIIMSS